jgi:uncharacterized membrane protein
MVGHSDDELEACRSTPLRRIVSSMWLTIIAATTAALSAINGGVFFAFSTFVTAGARRLPAVEAVHSFQAMNRAVPSSLYLPVFLLSGLGGAATAIVALVAGGSGWLIAGGAVAFVALVVSMAVNIPRNNVLDTLKDADAAAGWADYIGVWAVANHLRTLLCFVAVALLVTGLVIA